MDEEKLMEDMDWLRHACDWGDEQVDSILERIYKINPVKPVNTQLLFEAYDFLINYQTTTDEEHHRGMRHLCGLLQNVTSNNNGNATIARAAYCVGSMALFDLEDPYLMKQAFDTMIAYETYCTDRQKQRIFHIAPFLGEWGKMLDLGELWEKTNPRIMKQIDHTSIYNAHADYISIYELCKKYELNKVAIEPINTNEWKQFNISSIRTQLKNINFDKYDEYERHEIMNSFMRTEENNEYQWQYVPNIETCVFRRIGSVCDIYSEQDWTWWTNVCGPWFDNRVHVIGRQQTFKKNKDNLSPAKCPIVSNVYEIITEQYILEKLDTEEFDETGAEAVYKGNCGKTITQYETNTNKYLQSVVMDFECELNLGKQRKWKRKEDHDVILHNL